MKKRFFSVILAVLMLCLQMQITAFATEYTPEPLGDSGIQPYGSLSGYAQHYHSATAPQTGSFSITVNGSWSPYAGWTLKTDFDSCSYFKVYLTRPDGTKIGSELYPNATDEIKNQVLLNVPTGTYIVHYQVQTSCTGTIQVWIY